MIDRNSLIRALKQLEEKHHNKLGYGVKEILSELNENCDRKTEKRARVGLRFLISQKEHPEFLTAGNENIVYCPSGKNSGKYRLSFYS